MNSEFFEFLKNCDYLSLEKGRVEIPNSNIYGFFQNRKTTFHSNSPIYLVTIYIVIVFVLILISTWLQGLVANLLISTGIGFLIGAAPTVAAMVAGTFQMLVLFPIEKFVLFRK